MPSALPIENPGNAAAAFGAVLGSKIAEMLATRTIITPGPRAYRLAKTLQMQLH